MANNNLLIKARLSYLNVFKARGFQKDDEEKYSAVLLIPKKNKATIANIKKAINDAVEDGLEKYWSGKRPSNLWNPLRDGDTEKADQPEYAGMYFMTAKAQADRKPQLIDRDKNEIVDQTELYSGCWGVVDVTFFPFDNRMKGVGVGLNAIMKYKDDEAFGGGRSRDSIINGFDKFVDPDEDEDEDDDF